MEETAKKPRKKRKSGYVVLTERDEEILNFVGKFAVVNERHLIRLLDFKNDIQGYKNLARILDRLERGGYIKREKIRWKEPGYVLLGENGAALLNTRKPKGVLLNTLNHDMLTIDLYFLIRDKGAIRTEQEIRLEIGLEAARKVKIPDLILSDHIAYEVEISEKSNARVQKIINDYILNTRYARINYYAKSEALGHKIYTMSRGNDKIHVFIFDGRNFSTAKELPRTQPVKAAEDDRVSRFKNEPKNNDRSNNP